jgi:hypothetical protein
MVASCGGSPAVTCQTTACGTDAAKTYQICSHTNGNLSYNFGGQTCTCAASNSSQCQACDAQVANYCAGGGVGGTGGTEATGGTGGGGNVTCTATFSGGFTSTYSPCAVTVTDVPAGGVTQIGTAGNALPGTPYTWTGMSFVLSGSARTGTFDQTESTGATNQVLQTNSTNPPEWLAGFGNGMTFGTATLTITSLGPGTPVAGQTLYQSPHGTWTGTLVDQNPETAMPDVMETITF